MSKVLVQKQMSQVMSSGDGGGGLLLPIGAGPSAMDALRAVMNRPKAGGRGFTPRQRLAGAATLGAKGLAAVGAGLSAADQMQAGRAPEALLSFPYTMQQYDLSSLVNPKFLRQGKGQKTIPQGEQTTVPLPNVSSTYGSSKDPVIAATRATPTPFIPPTTGPPGPEYSTVPEIRAAAATTQALRTGGPIPAMEGATKPGPLPAGSPVNPETAAKLTPGAGAAIPEQSAAATTLSDTYPIQSKLLNIDPETGQPYQKAAADAMNRFLDGLVMK